MINDEQELIVVQNQLGRAERALADLRADVFSKNPRNFEIIAEGYTEEIDRLKAEISEYVSSRKSVESSTSPRTTPEQQPTNVH